MLREDVGRDLGIFDEDPPIAFELVVEPVAKGNEPGGWLNPHQGRDPRPHDNRAMPESIERLFAFAREAARANDWDAFRGRLGSLCRALESDDLSPALVQSLDTLSAANCALDPEGCRAELERADSSVVSPVTSLDANAPDVSSSHRAHSFRNNS